MTPASSSSAPTALPACSTDSASVSAMPWASLFNELNPHGANSTTPSGYSPLRLVYEIPASVLRTAKNVITVELYTDADLDAASTINVRLEGTMETATTSGWSYSPTRQRITELNRSTFEGK